MKKIYEERVFDRSRGRVSVNAKVPDASCQIKEVTLEIDAHGEYYFLTMTAEEVYTLIQALKNAADAKE